MNSSPPVSIVICNWNTPELTRRCVDSIRRFTRVPYRLVLVDNGSTDGASAAYLREQEDEQTRVVLLEGNRGFSGGYNRGMEAAWNEGPICLLNNDTLVTRGWLGAMLGCASRHGAGLVGPCTNRAKGPQRRRLCFGRIPPPLRRDRRVPFLSFFCVMLMRETIDRVGLLDERFGKGTYEDDDYCLRARRAGLKLVACGASWVWHEEQATHRANRQDTDVLEDENLAVFREKWGPTGWSHKVPPLDPAATLNTTDPYPGATPS